MILSAIQDMARLPTLRLICTVSLLILTVYLVATLLVMNYRLCVAVCRAGVIDV